MKTEQFLIKGMTCDNCVRHVTQALKGVKGVSSVSVNLNDQKATLEYDPELATVERMAAAVSGAGYTMEGKSG